MFWHQLNDNNEDSLVIGHNKCEIENVNLMYMLIDYSLQRIHK